MSTIRANTLVNMDGVTAVTLARQVASKVWVNFNGMGAATVRNSFNISSLTFNSTGNYTMSYTNALVDADYSATGMVSAQGVTWLNGLMIGDENGYTITTNTLRMSTNYAGSAGGNRENRNYVCMTIHR
jgi:hypothetical protein